MLKQTIAAALLAAIAGCAMQSTTDGGAPRAAAAAQPTNPLDPAYKARLAQLRSNYFDMLTRLDVNGDGLLSENEYCAPAGEDPLSPAYKKRQAEFKEMIAMMDTNKDGNMCLEEYMASANPLHPSHTR